MANYLKGKDRAYYDKHSKRSRDRQATVGERKYSHAWLSGFEEVWEGDGVQREDFCKTPFEKTAFKRGSKFAQKVLAKK